MFKPLDLHNLLLNPARIDVWQYSLHPTAHQPYLLNADEKHRASRYIFEKHRRRFQVARSMLRWILSRYLDQDPSELTFSENRYGKPSLDQAPSVQFNLSHSRDLALLAVGMQHPVGIDLEYCKERPFDGIARNMFSEPELLAFNQVDPSLKSLAFYHIWAQKEALIKACGLGLHYPTSTFHVPSLPSTQHLVFDPLHNKTWHMLTFTPDLECCAALCYEPNIQEIYYTKDVNAYTE